MWRALVPLPTSFHPAIRAWFDATFDAPTAAQQRGWAEMRAGRDALVAAPPGSGKTLGAFLWVLDRLLSRADGGTLPEGIDVLYVSPARALASDVQRNLEAPLAALHVAASSPGRRGPITWALESADGAEGGRRLRSATPRRSPHILVTTPESLYRALTVGHTRARLQRVSTVVVDEVHGLLGNRRGSHLALSLARLDAVTERRPQRIGLSAPLHPVSEAARFLSGPGTPCSVVDLGARRDLDLAIELPGTDLQPVATPEQWGEIHDRIAALVGAHRTTLVFVDTRHMAERVAHHLGDRLGPDRVAAHHDGLGKEARQRAEHRLRAGEVRALVVTPSLDPGVDAGSVELVCQIGSPRSITTFLHRIGRSGLHRARGRLFATSRDELVECAALVRAVAAGRLERVEPEVAPLDVLAQQIVAECAARDWSEDALFALVRGSAPYAGLPRPEFDAVVHMLRHGPGPRGPRGGALLHADATGGLLRARRSARLVAVDNGGVTPGAATFRVVLEPDGTTLSSVDERWAIESAAGDVFPLGGRTFRIRSVEPRAGLLHVEDAGGHPPSVPFWQGEAPGRSWELSLEVSRLRGDVVAAVDTGHGDVSAVHEWLAAECVLGPIGAAQLTDYVVAERDALGVVPTMDDVVLERFFDAAGSTQVVVHAPFGGRVNRALSLALKRRIEQAFDLALQTAATDDAVVLSMGAARGFPL